MGSYPSNWADGMHDHDGHPLRSAPSGRSGDETLVGSLGALMASQGVEYANGDVTNVHLDLKLVREARELEIP